MLTGLADSGPTCASSARSRTSGPLLTRADVVILPSLQEGMSNAVMEAMTAGRPIVTSAVGRIPKFDGSLRAHHVLFHRRAEA